MGEPEAAAANADPNKKDPNADLYETKAPKKLIRLVTVVAYMFSVSFVAIVLSAYYLFLWVPPDPKLLRRPNHLAAEPDSSFMLADDPPSDEIPLSGAGNFAGRIAGDDVDAKSRLNKRQENLDESLLILKMFLTEQQRKLRHDSAESSSSKGRLESETRTFPNVWVIETVAPKASLNQIFVSECCKQDFWSLIWKDTQQNNERK